MTTRLSLYENDKKINETILSPSLTSPINFIFPIEVVNEQSKLYRLQIPKDILNSDDEVRLKLDVKSSFAVILVDDEEMSSQRNSRLFFIRKFLESLELIFPKVLVRIIDMDSNSWRSFERKTRLVGFR